MKITRELLLRADAPEDTIKHFDAVWPDGFDLNIFNLITSGDNEVSLQDLLRLVPGNVGRECMEQLDHTLECFESAVKQLHDSYIRSSSLYLFYALSTIKHEAVN